MSNLNSEVRADRNGKLVTRHVRGEQSGASGKGAALNGAKPSLGGSKNPYKKHFSEFDFNQSPHEDYEPLSVDKKSEAGGKRTTHGSKFTGYRNVSEIAKDVRGDIKEAVNAGYLPDGLKYGVRVQKASMVQSLSINVSGLPDEMIYGGMERDRWGDERRSHTEFYGELYSRLSDMADAYNASSSDMMSDSYNNVYYSGVHINDAAHERFLEEEKARKQRKRRDEIDARLR